MVNTLSSEGAEQMIARINQLTENAQPLWGKMSVDQMLAHCNVAYDYTF